MSIVESDTVSVTLDDTLCHTETEIFTQSYDENFDIYRTEATGRASSRHQRLAETPLRRPLRGNIKFQVQLEAHARYDCEH